MWPPSIAEQAERPYISTGHLLDPEMVRKLASDDMWLVPAGIPHSIQALEGGCEFLLVFDDGNFSENETLLITEFMAHTPRSVLSKNFGIEESKFDGIPKSEKYIFRLPVPAPLDQVRIRSSRVFVSARFERS